MTPNPLSYFKSRRFSKAPRTGISFAGMIKALCMAGNILVQVSPYPQVQRWELRGSTGRLTCRWVFLSFGVFLLMMLELFGDSRSKLIGVPVPLWITTNQLGDEYLNFTKKLLQTQENPIRLPTYRLPLADGSGVAGNKIFVRPCESSGKIRWRTGQHVTTCYKYV